jgi:uncharacterized protein (TIGR02118 family)
MHRLLVAYPCPADPERFLAYYQSIHLPLARRLPGLLGCRWMRPEGLPPGQAPAHWLLFEADFADGAAMGAALASPEGAAVAADVPNYSPGGAVLMHYEVPADR